MASAADALNAGKPCVGALNSVVKEASGAPPIEMQMKVIAGQAYSVEESRLESRWVRIKTGDKEGWVPYYCVRIYQGRLGKSTDTNKPCVAIRNFTATVNEAWLWDYFHLAVSGSNNYPSHGLQGSARVGEQGTVVTVSADGQWTKWRSSAFKGEMWVPSNCLRIGLAEAKQGPVASIGKYNRLAACAHDFDGSSYTHWDWMSKPSTESQIKLCKGDLVMVTAFDENLAWVKVITYDNPSSEGWVRFSCLSFDPDRISAKDTSSDGDVLFRLVVTKKGFTPHNHVGQFQPSPTSYGSFVADEQGVVKKISPDRRWKLVEFYNRQPSKSVWLLSSLVRSHDMPCIITATYAPNAGELKNNCIPAMKGDEAVMRFWMINDYCFVHRLKAPEDQKRYGWIPKGYIQFGCARSYGDLIIEVKAPPRFTDPSLLVQHVRNEGQGLKKHIGAVLQAWKDNLDYLPFWGSTFRQIVATDQSLENFLNRIMNGVHEARMLNLLSRNTFEFHELMDARTGVEISRSAGHRHDIPGIYVIGHWDFRDDPTLKRLYCGETGSFSTRAYQHDYGYKNPTTSYYRAVQKSKSHKMVPVCVLKNSTKEERRVVEQTFFVLLETFRPDIFSITSKPDTEVFRTGHISEDSELALQTEEDEDDAEESVPSHGPARGGISYAGAQQAAYRLSTIANAALRKTGRPLGKPWKGLNFSPPATETRSGSLDAENERIWVKTTLSENLLQFRLGNPKPIDVGKGKRIQLTLLKRSRGGEEDFFCIYIGDDVLSEAGINLGKVSKLTVVAELKLDGQHPRSWARLPAVGPYDDWQLCTGLAIKIEFMQKGMWYQFYVQKAQPTQLALRYNDPISPGSFTAYTNASNFVAYLLLRERHNLPFWHEEYGVANKMREQVYDHLNQRITVQEIRAERWLRPSTVPIGVIGQAMKDAGAKNVGAPFGTIKTWGKIIPGGKKHPRRSCDACALNTAWIAHQELPTALCEDNLAAYGKVNAFGKDFLKRNREAGFKSLSLGGCVKQEGTDGQCTRCWLYGRPCSWTHTDELVKLDKLQVLLMHQKPYQGVILGGGSASSQDSDNDEDDDDQLPPKPQKKEFIQDMNMRTVMGVSAEIRWAHGSD
ncbi:hypothetical protein SLS55_003291 [Diplodia seriata]|uniref:SH3 domain-containing protein n=1 Tax=Diplodia seriata TaxID=420778 RepID=A0ABR3CMS5_9PEZI